MTYRFGTAALGLAALLALSATAGAATKLLVYTALEADQLKEYEAAFGNAGCLALSRAYTRSAYGRHSLSSWP